MQKIKLTAMLLNLFLIVIINSLLFSQDNVIEPNNSNLYLKTGQSLVGVTIVEINNWGIKLSDGQCAMFRQFAKVTTDKKSVAFKIKLNLDSLIITNDSLNYILDFSHAVVRSAKDYGIDNADYQKVLSDKDRIAETNLSQLKLKSGFTVLETNILEINEWGIKLDNNETAVYKVIANITTNKKSVVDKISAIVDSLKISVKDSIYEVDFSNAVIRPINRVKYGGKNYQELFLFCNALSNRGEMLEIGAMFTPKNMETWFFRFAFTYGIYTENVEFPISSYSEEKRKSSVDYNVSGFVAGIGRKLSFDGGEMIYGINLGVKVVNDINDKDNAYNVGNENYKQYSQSSFVSYLQLGINKKLFLNWLYVMADARLYIANIEVLNKTDRLTASFGFGISL